jgi:DNA-binding winged helix-turn-helix (wHTH) protein
LLSGVTNNVLEFGDFRLEPAERRLTRGGAVLDVSGRYLDALLLLTRQPGELITKDRFMAEVWRGVPVTDEALTQCIRSLRKALGDQVGSPRFIETVPRHGYRFLAEVRQGGQQTSAQNATITPPRPPLRWLPWFDVLLLGGAGLAGGAAAGLLGGIGYGLLAATEPPPGTGAVSILLVMTCVCLLVGMIGGLGVAGGSALGRMVARGRLLPLMLGGALGGMVVGALGRLIGLDAFSLLIGSRPLAITGGSEGLLVGAMAGAALWLSERGRPTLVAKTVNGALLGAMAGLLVTLGGGKMMAGSLAGLAAAHPEAPLGPLLASLTPPLLLVAAAVEGAIFVAALALSFTLTLRSRSAD